MTFFFILPAGCLGRCNTREWHRSLFPNQICKEDIVQSVTFLFMHASMSRHFPPLPNPLGNI